MQYPEKSLFGCSSLLRRISPEGIGRFQLKLEQGIKEMLETSTIVVGSGPDRQPLGQAMRLANRHGLVAGATGTGKTVTLQRLAEVFSDAGVAVFAADVKGDLCGLGRAHRRHAVAWAYATGLPGDVVGYRGAVRPPAAHDPQ